MLNRIILASKSKVRKEILDKNNIKSLVMPSNVDEDVVKLSLLKEKALQPIYYPSINKKNLDNFSKKFFKEFNYYPNHLSLLSYDLIGLIYYLSLKNNISEIYKSFKSKNSFKGKIGVFDIEDNKINHKLNFYQVNDGQIKEIF